MDCLTLRHHRVHGNVMRLGMDRRNRLLGISNAERLCSRTDHLQSSIEKTASVSKPVATRIKTHDGSNDDVRSNLLRTVIRNRNIPNAAYQRGAWRPQPENQRLMALNDNRQSKLTAAGVNTFDPRAKIRLAAKWPIASHDMPDGVSYNCIEPLDNSRRMTIAKIGWDRKASSNQPFALGLPPMCYVVICLRSRLGSQTAIVLVEFVHETRRRGKLRPAVIIL